MKDGNSSSLTIDQYIIAQHSKFEKTVNEKFCNLESSTSACMKKGSSRLESAVSLLDEHDEFTW